MNGPTGGEPGRALRAAVNLLWCVPGEVGGSEEYLTRQLVGLTRIDPDRRSVEPTLFALEGYVAAHPELAAAVPTVSPRADGRARSRRVAIEHTWLARRTSAGRFDLVHHGGGTAPSVGARPCVLTIHDLQYLVHPEFFSPVKLRYLRSAVPRSVGRAAVVTTPTDHVRATVVDAFGISADRVVVVPHGITPPPVDRAPVDEAALRARYDLGRGPVLVYPAITHPHKNHGVLLEALARHWTDPDLRLVLLGGRGAADHAVSARIADLGLADRVIRPGRVPDEDRDGLLGIADALVFPSRFEGFGAPVIEAMALGTPVICSDDAALAEVVGDAAIVVDADDVEAWGAAPAEARRRRAELVELGRERVNHFTVETSASALVDAYRRAVA